MRRGSLDDTDSLRAGAADADGVIHLAFKHDFGNFAAASAADLNAVQAMGDVLAGSGRPLVIASGTLMLAMIAPGRPGTEDIVAGPELAAAARVASELAVLAMPDRGVRTSIVRLSPTVHGDGDRGFVPRLIDIARDKGVAAYVGDGANRWPAVHFGFLGAFVQLDNPTSTELTRQRTGSQPAHPGLIADLEEGHYFAAGSYSKY